MSIVSKMRSVRASGLLLLLGLTLLFSPAFAQAAKGLITGKVVDAREQPYQGLRSH